MRSGPTRPEHTQLSRSAGPIARGLSKLTGPSALLFGPPAGQVALVSLARFSGHEHKRLVGPSRAPTLWSRQSFADWGPPRIRSLVAEPDVSARAGAEGNAGPRCNRWHWGRSLKAFPFLWARCDGPIRWMPNRAQPPHSHGRPEPSTPEQHSRCTTIIRAGAGQRAPPPPRLRNGSQAGRHHISGWGWLAEPPPRSCNRSELGAIGELNRRQIASVTQELVGVTTAALIGSSPAP